MPIWTFLDPKADREILGFLPWYLSDEDPAPAREQLDRNYQRVAGCGWSPMKGHALDRETLILKYPGDPPSKPIAQTKLRDELIVLYPYSFVAVVQPDGSFEVCRMD